jgi:hypothetical protein
VPIADLQGNFYDLRDSPALHSGYINIFVTYGDSPNTLALRKVSNQVRVLTVLQAVMRSYESSANS